MVCDNLYGPNDNENTINANQLQGDGFWSAPEPPRPLGQNKYAFWYDGFTSNLYYLKVIFNLGAQHQDNPFASVGRHWLAHGDEMLEVIVPFTPAEVNQRSTLIGPFATRSDRCHEFWLRLSFSISD